MKSILREDILLDSIIASIENFKWCCKNEERKRSFLYRIEYFIWFILLIFFTPHKESKSTRMVCAMTHVNEEIIMRVTENDVCFRFAKLNATLRSTKVSYSVLSPYTLIERIGILNNAIRFFFRYHSKLEGYLHFVLEYYSITTYIDENNMRTIYSNCTYDRYNTFLAIMRI